MAETEIIFLHDSHALCSSVLVVIESYGFPSCGIYRNWPLDLLLAQSEMLKMCYPCTELLRLRVNAQKSLRTSLSSVAS